VARGPDYDWLGAAAAPDVVTGWRLWQVVRAGSDVRLAAWSAPELQWPPRRRCEARCLLDLGADHIVPQPGCRCGLYAYRTRELAERALAAEMRPEPVVLGRVSLWGRIVGHQRGWRSQYGYPYELYSVGDDHAVARALRSAYAVDASPLRIVELLGRVRAEERRLYAERTAFGRAA
jgi:hypothetical protein